MQIKITVRFNYTLMRRAQLKTNTHTHTHTHTHTQTRLSIIKDAKELELPYNDDRIQNGKWFGSFLKSYIYLPSDPDFPLLGIYPKEVKAYDYVRTYM